MKRYTGNDLKKLYEEAPRELEDRVRGTLAALPETGRQDPAGGRRFKVGLTAALAVLLCLATAAFATGTIQKWLHPYEYILLDDGNAEITKYNAGGETADIPGEIDGHPVTKIGSRAFYQCHSLRKVRSL